MFTTFLAAWGALLALCLALGILAGAAKYRRFLRSLSPGARRRLLDRERLRRRRSARRRLGSG